MLFVLILFLITLIKREKYIFYHSHLVPGNLIGCFFKKSGDFKDKLNENTNILLLERLDKRGKNNDTLYTFLKTTRGSSI